MDTLRGNFGRLGDPYSEDTVEDEAVDHAPPPEIGADERRMQVRAYNFWASLLDNRNFPNVADLDPDTLPDFGPNGVLLDFSQGMENPAISFLGDRLADECGAQGLQINVLSDVPARSLLSRITDHYMQILANQAPIGFEAEFVNQRGSTILYRGILLPFSSDDETIDFIYGVINWKEMAEAGTAEELLLEIEQELESDQPLETSPPLPSALVEETAMADWADGPGTLDVAPEIDGLPAPSFGLTDHEMEAPAPELAPEPEPAPAAALAPMHAAAQVELPSAAALDPAFMGLSDWLASARQLAADASNNEDRTRSALYDAIGRAHDFALATLDAPEEFAEMVEDAGLKMQARAPMTPIVKLVFGADYDKTRLTEYAAALTHAQRRGLERGMLADFLGQAEGGLKGVVKEERRLRREESGKPAKASATGPRNAIARKLRAIQPRTFEAIAHDGEEFALVMVRRMQGDVVVLGEVPEDTGLVEKAARKLLG